MSGKFQLKGGISEVNFGYNAKMEVYANSSSDIPMLSDMSSNTKLASLSRFLLMEIIR